MFKTLLAQLSQHYEKQLPFVVYRKPKQGEVIALLQNDNLLHTSKNYSETGFIFAPFDELNQSILIQAHSRLESTFESNQALQFVANTDDFINTRAKEFHLNLVARGIEEIGNGSLHKVVLSRCSELLCSKSPFVLFQNILTYYESAFCYLWYHPKVGTWLGATPEKLLRVVNNNFATMSLAATQQHVNNQDPQWSDKEIEEQQIVTDYIKTAIKYHVTNLQISERESIRSGQLWHLKNSLSGTLKDTSLLPIVRALHPTPAVCGTPLSTAKNFILQHENYSREFYTGFLGEINIKSQKKRSKNRINKEHQVYHTITKTSELYVNLRCMQLKNDHALIYAGGGITKDSIAEDEWLETVAKMATMSRIIEGK